MKINNENWNVKYEMTENECGERKKSENGNGRNWQRKENNGEENENKWRKKAA